MRDLELFGLRRYYDAFGQPEVRMVLLATNSLPSKLWGLKNALGVFGVC